MLQTRRRPSVQATQSRSWLEGHKEIAADNPVPEVSIQLTSCSVAISITAMLLVNANAARCCLGATNEAHMGWLGSGLSTGNDCSCEGEEIQVALDSLNDSRQTKSPVVVQTKRSA